MYKKLIYTTPALDSIDNIRKYIEFDSIERADKYCEDLVFKIRNLKQFSNLGISIGNNQYKYVINKNYLVYYFILNSIIYILSVKHVKNNWKFILDFLKK